MSEKLCGTCRWFNFRPGVDEEGTCDEISNTTGEWSSEKLAWTEGYDRYSTLNVKPSFGCVLWEPKEKADEWRSMRDV